MLDPYNPTYSMTLQFFLESNKGEGPLSCTVLQNTEFTDVAKFQLPLLYSRGHRTGSINYGTSYSNNQGIGNTTAEQQHAHRTNQEGQTDPNC